MSPIADLDVYALIDADTDEARAFTTYLGYWVCLAQHVESRYGSPCYEQLLAVLEGRGLAALRANAPNGDERVLRSMLLNAWSSELALHLVEPNDAQRLWLANQWG